MKRLHAAMLIGLFALALASRTANAGDALEFKSVEGAAAAGWIATGDSTLAVSTDAAVGKTALVSVAGENVRRYRGLRLTRRIDLTGATAADHIEFRVKQPSATRVRVQLAMTGGVSAWRSAPVTKGRWTKVSVNFDPAAWQSTKDKPIVWGPALLTVNIPSNTRAPAQLLLDGLRIVIGGRERPLQPEAVRIETDAGKWQLPEDDAQAWYLGSDRSAWAVAKESGQVVGGWNPLDGRQLVRFHEGHYHIENRQARLSVHEREDRVVHAKRAGAQLDLVCRNPRLPFLRIRKLYTLEAKRLVRTVTFEVLDDTLRFVTYNSELSLVPDYRDTGYYMGAGFLGPIIPAPTVKDRKKVTRYKSTSKGMVLHHPIAKVGVAHQRIGLDGNYAWPWFSMAITGHCEEMNALTYTRTGWEMSLGTSPLQKNRITSFSEELRIFPGTWFDFLAREHAGQPEVRAEMANIPPVPDWVADIKVYAGFRGMHDLRSFAASTGEGQIVCLTGAASWADYRIRDGMNGNAGGWITGPEMKSLVQRAKAISPRIRFGLYHWMHSTTANTRIYQEHPEWFRHTDRDGNEAYLFPSAGRNFAAMFSKPDCYRALLGQMRDEFTYLQSDFVNLDSSKGINVVDWDSGAFNRDDLCYRLLKDIKRVAYASDPDRALFLNGRALPYADFNFIESRARLRAGWWRRYAGTAAAMETFLTAIRPGSRVIPLYWVPTLRREYINRCLALGWIPAVGGRFQMNARAWFQATYEMGDTNMVGAHYSPDYTNDPQTTVESYCTRRPGEKGVILSLISHAKTTITVPVEIDLKSVGLTADDRLQTWLYSIDDAMETAGRFSEAGVRTAWQDDRWQVDGVCGRTRMAPSIRNGQLRVALPMQPLRLYQLYLTPAAALVRSEEDLPANYLFEKNRKVRLSTRRAGAFEATCTVESQRNRAEVVLALPVGMQLVRCTLDNKPCPVTWQRLGGTLLPMAEVGKGTHELAYAWKPGNPSNADPDAQARVENDRIVLSGLKPNAQALVSLSRNGRTVTSRTLAVNGNGSADLPLSTWRNKGAYTLSIDALVMRSGALHALQRKPLAVTLTKGSAPKRQRKKPHPAIPPKAVETPVNRTINGLNVLSAATYTGRIADHELQPGVPPLVAKADPEALRLSAGTGRVVFQFRGAAFAGLEIGELRTLALELKNTYNEAFCYEGKGVHRPKYKRSLRLFAGLLVDYHTPNGYSRRVAFSVAAENFDCNTPYPPFGANRPPDHVVSFGDLVTDHPSRVFSIDLAAHAPKDWDGRVWVYAGSDWIRPGRRLQVTLLTGERAAVAKPLTGYDRSDMSALIEKPRELSIRRLSPAPVIDGDRGDEIYQSVRHTMKDFIRVGVSARSPIRTEAKIFYDVNNLYLMAFMEEKNRKSPKISGGGIWGDDCIEVWIDADGDGKSYHQILVNGTNQTLTLTEAGQNPIPIESAVRMQPGKGWCVEIAIPFRSLGVKPPKKGERWRFNLCRTRPGGDGISSTELSSWAPLKKGYNELDAFGSLIFQ